jgi:hypothetical protein
MRLFAAAIAVAMIVTPVTAMAGPSIVGPFTTPPWNPADPAWELTENTNGVWVLTKTMTAADTLYKAVDGDSWGLDFPGNNQNISHLVPGDVTWYVNLGATDLVKEGDEYVFHDGNPPIVCGNFMSELGGSDWDETDTSTTVMTDGDGDDVWEFSAVIAPAGTYDCKVVLNNNWDQDTYPNSLNYTFNSDGSTPVSFYYDMSNNNLDIFSTAPMSVVWARLKHDDCVSTEIVELKFSAAVDVVTGENPANYDVAPGRTVVTATRDATDHTLIYLGVTPALVEGVDYTVTATGVLDEANGQPVDPAANDACFYVEKVQFELNMHLYVDANGLPATVHIQGDTYPLTWGQAEGCQAYDDGVNGGDVAAGDTTYTVTHYFSTGYECGARDVAAADTVDVKYKYLVDGTIWEGDYEFGHYLTLNPADAFVIKNVWWEDIAPVDNIQCDVGVKYQVHMKSAIDQGLFSPGSDTLLVTGSESPLSWLWPGPNEAIMVDDGSGYDETPGDEVYTAMVVFPTGTYRFLEYKYAIKDTSQPNGVRYECDTYPNRQLELDDVDGCMPARVGPMEIEDLWDWCESITTPVPEGDEVPASWGRIKSIYR